ncbi:hypothetical protein PM082_019069 [Marasmius tenuissimus]|nr:hypothetical protein PM082_019069 [Marasmius tenuissimus]
MGSSSVVPRSKVKVSTGSEDRSTEVVKLTESVFEEFKALESFSRQITGHKSEQVLGSCRYDSPDGSPSGKDGS